MPRAIAVCRSFRCRSASALGSKSERSISNATRYHDALSFPAVHPGGETAADRQRRGVPAGCVAGAFIARRRRRAGSTFISDSCRHCSVHGWIWQLVTYAFLHAGLLHILFNMLALVDVRRAAGDGLGLQPVHAVLFLLRDRSRAGHGCWCRSPACWARPR